MWCYLAFEVKPYAIQFVQTYGILAQVKFPTSQVFSSSYISSTLELFITLNAWNIFEWKTSKLFTFCWKNIGKLEGVDPNEMYAIFYDKHLHWNNFNSTTLNGSLSQALIPNWIELIESNQIMASISNGCHKRIIGMMMNAFKLLVNKLSWDLKSPVNLFFLAKEFCSFCE